MRGSMNNPCIDFESVSLSRIGKMSDKWASYPPVYAEVINQLRIDIKSILEIGVQKGGSLEAWVAACPEVDFVVGVDIDPECGDLCFKDQRIQVIIGDATSSATAREIKRVSPSFEIIVDDGSHSSPDIIQAFGRYLPHLTPGGAYVIEDLHCSYWPNWGGGLATPTSAISFLKRLVDVVNSEHWVESVGSLDVIAGFLPELSAAELAELVLALPRIKSIEFLDSLCVVRTFVNVPETRLGSRLLLGGGSGPVETFQIAKELQSPIPEKGDALLLLIDPRSQSQVSVAVQRAFQLESEVDRLSYLLSASVAEQKRLEENLQSVLSSRSWRWGQKLAKLAGRRARTIVR
jgi:hypothetical protein